MFSHQVGERKWAHDKSPLISTLYVILMDRFYLSHLSAAGSRDIFLEDGKLLDREKETRLRCLLLQTVSIYTRWPFQSAKTYDICTSAESLVDRSAPHRIASHGTALTVMRRGSRRCVTGSPHLRNNSPLTCTCLTSLLLGLGSETQRRHGDFSAN